MKKVIVSLIVSLLAAMLGIVGLNLFKDAGPRERMKAENGSRIIVEELSFYRHGDKVFGKIFKPTDENGFFPDSLGPRPVLIFFHEPLKTAVTKAAYRLKKSVSGLILIEPEVSESVSRLTPKLGYEVLTVSTSEKTSARIKILDYLEIRGALK